jgi:glutathione S-transferase
MLELYQAEWCPSSRHVRQRLTELGIDYVNRQVPARREARIALRVVVGADTIPALRLENGATIVGADNILAHLGEYAVESPEAEAHRQRAALMRRPYLDDECDCARASRRGSPGTRDLQAVATPGFQREGRQGGGGGIT